MEENFLLVILLINFFYQRNNRILQFGDEKASELVIIPSEILEIEQFRKDF